MEKRRAKINFKVVGRRMKRAYGRMRPAQRRRVIFSIAWVVIGVTAGLLVGGGAGRMIAEKKAEAEIKSTEKKLYKIQDQLQEANRRLENTGILENDALEERLAEFKDGIPWNMTLVNAVNPLEGGYVPELAEVENGYSVDARAAEDLSAMLGAARQAGLQPEICSAYRSEEKQIQVFSDTVAGWVNQGYNYWEAYRRTSQEVALPGTSEHALGLSVDIVSSQYQQLDEGQAETPEAKWLQENCYDFGFILRYPQDKQSHTGIIYEPWHYRYVGKEYAKKIKESGLTLEEYLGESY